jgi:hypothetical protein
MFSKCPLTKAMLKLMGPAAGSGRVAEALVLLGSGSTG